VAGGEEGTPVGDVAASFPSACGAPIIPSARHLLFSSPSFPSHFAKISPPSVFFSPNVIPPTAPGAFEETGGAPFFMTNFNPLLKLVKAHSPTLATMIAAMRTNVIGEASRFFFPTWRPGSAPIPGASIPLSGVSTSCAPGESTATRSWSVTGSSCARGLFLLLFHLSVSIISISFSLRRPFSTCSRSLQVIQEYLSPR